MEPMNTLAKIMIFLGVTLILFGLLLFIFSKVSFKGFRLPGDIYYEKDGVKIFFPIMTSLLISLILTIVLNLIFLFFKK